MSRARRADHELDALIDGITIDCYNEAEALTAFENAFDEDAHRPRMGTVIGEHVETLSIADSSKSLPFGMTVRRVCPRPQNDPDREVLLR